MHAARRAARRFLLLRPDRQLCVYLVARFLFIWSWLFCLWFGPSIVFNLIEAGGWFGNCFVSSSNSRILVFLLVACCLSRAILAFSIWCYQRCCSCILHDCKSSSAVARWLNRRIYIASPIVAVSSGAVCFDKSVSFLTAMGWLEIHFAPSLVVSSNYNICCRFR